jgi:hypothetical protein
VLVVFAQQKKLEMEAKTLQAQANRFVKQTTQWLTLVDTFNQSLKVLHLSLSSFIPAFSSSFTLFLLSLSHTSPPLFTSCHC